MSNLISRQSAIAILDRWLQCKDYSEGEVNIMRAMRYELENLPSAQPETHEKRTETHGVCSDGMIKRTDAIDALRTCYDTEAVTYTNGNECISYDQALDLIEALPSADAVEVVRCKDCKFYVKNNPTVLCLRDSGNPEWFCADGERRE